MMWAAATAVCPSAVEIRTPQMAHKDEQMVAAVDQIAYAVRQLRP
jgi:hypothetical protein